MAESSVAIAVVAGEELLLVAEDGAPEGKCAPRAQREAANLMRNSQGRTERYHLDDHDGEPSRRSTAPNTRRTCRRPALMSPPALSPASASIRLSGSSRECMKAAEGVAVLSSGVPEIGTSGTTNGRRRAPPAPRTSPESPRACRRDPRGCRSSPAPGRTRHRRGKARGSARPRPRPCPASPVGGTAGETASRCMPRLSTPAAFSRSNHVSSSGGSHCGLNRQVDRRL